MFYGDLVYKFKRIFGKPNLIDQFKTFIKHYKIVQYNMDIMLQSACLVVNQITVNSYGFLLHDDWSGLRLNAGPDVKLYSVAWCLMIVVGRAHCSST